MFDTQIIYNQCSPYTLTSIERVSTLFHTIKDIINNDIEGDFVECGVFKGGSVISVADSLKMSTKKSLLNFPEDTRISEKTPSKTPSSQPIELYPNKLVS